MRPPTVHAEYIEFMGKEYGYIFKPGKRIFILNCTDGNLIEDIQKATCYAMPASHIARAVLGDVIGFWERN